MRAHSASLSELCTYLSRLELEHLASDEGTAPAETRLDGAILFVDVSGFTPITEELAKQGPLGAEILSEILSDYYVRLTQAVAEHGGDVLFFAGDAAVSLFRADDDDLSTALGAATLSGLAIVSRLDGFAPGKASGLRLSLRATVGAGVLRVLRVGKGPRLLLVTGEPFEEICRLNSRKRGSGVVLTQTARDLLPAAGSFRELGDGAVEVLRLRAGSIRVQSARPVPPDAAAVERVLPEVVVQRTHAGQSEFLAEFRTVTLVFVGLVRREMLANLGELHAAVTALEELVLRFDGAVYQFIDDDKGTTLIVSFGVPPRTHEDDAARAALFATLAFSALADRGEETAIGVATGRVLCGAYGGPMRRQYSLVGPAVNRAARLMQAAREHGVLCDDATRRSAGRDAGFEPVGSIRLKGVEAVVPVFRPGSDAVPRSRRRRGGSVPGGLVGRERQVELLAEALAAVRSGNRPGHLLLRAEAGMGKSRLVAEFCRLCREHRIRFFLGEADALETRTPFFAFRPLLAALLGIDGLGADAAQARVLSALDDAQDLPPLAPLLALVLPLDWTETPLTEQMSPQVRAENLTRLMLHLVRRAAEQEPLVLVLEDAHWLDSASWALLALVRRFVPQATLVVTSRPMFPELEEYVSFRNAASVVTLPALGREHTIRIMAERLNVQRVPHELIDFVVGRTEGNPFYIEEIALSLRDAGSIGTMDGADIVGSAPFADLSLTRSLEAVITSRIDRLATNEQLVLKVASVVGRRFDEASVRETMPVPEDREGLSAVLLRLQEHDWLVPEPDGIWSFRHALTRETIYGLLSYSQRRGLHRAVALYLERRHRADLTPIYARLAHHYGHAEDTENAMTAYGNAGEQSLGAYANQEAIAFLERALELDLRDARPRAGFRRARWQKLLGDAHYSLGHQEAARVAYEAALMAVGYAKPKGLLGAGTELLVHVARRARRRVTGRTTTIVRGEERERVLHAMQTLPELGAVLLWKGERTTFLESALMRRNMADQLGPSGESASAMCGAGYVLAMMGLHRLGERDIERAVALAEQHGTLEPKIQAHTIHGMFLSAVGRPACAVRPLERAGRLADQLGGGLWRHRAKFMLGEPLLLLGAYERAASVFEEAAVHSVGAESAVVGFSYAMQALSWLRLGNIDTALSLLEGPQGVQLIRPSTASLQLFASLGPLAEARLIRGDLAGALAAAREAEAAAPGDEANGFFAGIHGHAAVCHVHLTIAEEARQGKDTPASASAAHGSARHAVALFRKFTRTYPGALPSYLVMAGRLAALDGDLRTAKRSLKRAAIVAARQKMPHEYATARRQLGRLEGSN